MVELRVDNGVINELAKEFQCGRQAVSLALRGASSSRRAREIRALAIAKYNARAIKEIELTPREILDGACLED